MNSLEPADICESSQGCAGFFVCQNRELEIKGINYYSPRWARGGTYETYQDVRKWFYRPFLLIRVSVC